MVALSNIEKEGEEIKSGTVKGDGQGTTKMVNSIKLMRLTFVLANPTPQP